MNRIVVYIVAFFIAYYLTSCDSGKLEVDVPAYIRIDSVKVVVQEGQGTSYQKITDVWVNMDGKRVGTFSLPAKFPVIGEGNHTIKIWAGVLKNGIHDYRERFVFFQNDEHKIDLVPNQEHLITPVFKYLDESILDVWVEDFDLPAMSFHTVDSLNVLQKIEEIENPDNKFGYVCMHDSSSFFDFYTQRGMKLGRTPIYMELEYKSTVTFAIGVRVKKKDGGYRLDNPFTYIKAQEDWNKLYINLSEQFNISSDYAEAYDVYFVVPRNEDLEKSELYLDNVKILSFK